MPDVELLPANEIIPWEYQPQDELFFAEMSQTRFAWFERRKPRLDAPHTWRAWVIRDDAAWIVCWGHLEPFDDCHKLHVVRLGVAVTASHRGRGLGSRMAGFLVAEAKRRGFRKAWATYHADNIPMARIWQKLGFAQEGRFVGEEIWEGAPVDVVSVARWL